MNNSDFTKIPLHQTATDILGLDFEEIRPRIKSIEPMKSDKPYICIANHSTAQSKYWNNPTGWQELVDYVKELGYDVYLLSKEEDGYMGNKNPIGITQQPVGSLSDVIKVMQESELFIGISSGLSWLAWGADVPVVLISGFTDIYTEPFIGVNRVINKNVCNSCWNRHDFDAGDWNWCPDQKGTDRQFECSKEISSESVITEIKKLLKL
jgi:autotransporter strand-loop-strand O-heptosyltransferase